MLPQPNTDLSKYLWSQTPDCLPQPSSQANGMPNYLSAAMPEGLELPARPLGLAPPANQIPFAMSNALNANPLMPPPPAPDVRIALEIEARLNQLDAPQRQRVVDAMLRNIAPANGTADPSPAPNYYPYPVPTFGGPYRSFVPPRMMPFQAAATTSSAPGIYPKPWYVGNHPAAGQQQANGAESSRTSWASYQAMMAKQPAIPGYRHFSYRTAPCKHFSQSNGQFCPLGDDCNYIHDKKLMWRPYTGWQRTPTGIIFKKTTHCWAFVQGLCRVQDCPYIHPRDAEPYVKYTPCLAWPFCKDGDNCRYKHPERLPETDEDQGSFGPGLLHPSNLPQQQLSNPPQAMPGQQLVTDMNQHYPQPEGANSQPEKRAIRRPPPLNLMQNEEWMSSVRGPLCLPPPVPYNDRMTYDTRSPVQFGNYQFPLSHAGAVGEAVPAPAAPAQAAGPGQQRVITPPTATQAPAPQAPAPPSSPRVAAPPALASIKEEEKPWYPYQPTNDSLSIAAGSRMLNTRRQSVSTKQSGQDASTGNAGDASLNAALGKRQSWSAWPASERHN
ncbi:hypothetical protein EVG20_g4233 [Dentipellis fragilis]|uniref:C3H1-type domain-containing protein n=1 Tax=Dentipellis fragilis TaxID=205917 RepID=A0A4Y9YX04_9AGAM|nr:hypothetical protein EVG20_g4233 [Dentipellis fragilis]